ncbi:MAG: hypothetical protein NVS4B11_24340 [Ktedonobacteraceae bacterium]
MNDPLAQFRQGQPQARVANKSTRTGKKAYEAYDKKGKPCPYTEILCISQPSQSPQSRFFLAAVFSADEGAKIEVPLDIVMSLLRPDALEKLRNYITSYLMKPDNEIA